MIPTVEKLFRRIAVDEKLKKDYSIMVRENAKFQGCIGKIFYVVLKNGEIEVKFVVKFAPNDESCRMPMAVRENFWNECLFYEKILPEFESLQLKLLGKIYADLTPKCYLTDNKEFEEKIVLENLKSAGYEVYDKRKPFDDEHMKGIFKKYAELHGLSFAMKHKYPEKFDQLAGEFREVYSRIHPLLFRDQLKLVYKQCRDCFKTENDEDLKEKLNLYETGDEIFFDSLKNDYEHSVLVHGDCWSNNLMFKYDECRTLLDVKLIDFQATNLRTPAHDLSYCLYANGSSKEFSNLDKYLQIYHDHLKNFLLPFKVNVNDVYPFERLMGDWKKNCKFGFSMALLLIKFKFTFDNKELEVPEILTATTSMKEIENERYDEGQVEIRYKELVRHLHRRDFL